MYWMFLLFSIFIVNVDEENSKDVLDILEVRVSAHKGENPDDSEDYAAIGLSSEEEAEDLPDNEYIRRKFQIPPPVPDPVPPFPTVSSGEPTTSIQVTVAMLQQVHQVLGQFAAGSGHCSWISWLCARTASQINRSN